MSFGSEVCCEQWAFWLGVVGFQYDPWGPSKLDKEHIHTHTKVGVDFVKPAKLI